MIDKRITPDKIKYNAKLQIQKYIESFFNGNNKKYLQISAPSTINYNIDNSIQEVQNVKEKKLQIARYFNELKSVLPAILIVDGNMKNIPNSFSSVTNVFGNIATPEFELSPCREIDIGILVGSNDQQTTDELASAVSLLFCEFRQFGGGNLLVGDLNKNESWSVTLPLDGISFGSVQDQDISGDSVSKIFYCEGSITIRYEDKIRFKIDSKNDLELKQKSKGTPKILLPDTISIGSKTKIIIENFNPENIVMVDSISLATISGNGYLIARSFGKFNLIVKNKRGEVVDSKQIEIV